MLGVNTTYHEGLEDRFSGLQFTLEGISYPSPLKRLEGYTRAIQGLGVNTSLAPCKGFPSKGINPAWGRAIPYRGSPASPGQQDTLRRDTLTTLEACEYPLGFTLTSPGRIYTLVGRCLPYVVHVGCRQMITLYKGMNPPTILTLCRQGHTLSLKIILTREPKIILTREPYLTAGLNFWPDLAFNLSPRILGEK